VRLQLGRLDAAKVPQDMNLPGWKFHPLGKDLARHYAVTVNKNWRLTFAFEQGDAVLVDYQDYH
jgi:toxin HigB-1